MNSEKPIAFRVREDRAARLADTMAVNGTRVAVRALDGMQKEALVAIDGGVWRLLCDEGHYLNGTDLAPPPLDFFAAGMQFSMMSAALSAARQHNVPLRSIRLLQDNVYEINGSFLRGDAQGFAKPPQLRLALEPEEGTTATTDVLTSIARRAVGRTTALALVRDVLANRFELAVRGERLPLDAMNEVPVEESVASAPIDELFDGLEPDASPRPREQWIVKTSQAERIENHRNGAGVGLEAEQKRTIHIRSSGRWLGDDAYVTDVDLLQPIGSSFRFRSEGARSDAHGPPPDAFVASGIALCFMTQLGRYAAIRKHVLDAYSVVQTSTFDITSDAAVARPLDTAVFFETASSPEVCSDLVRTGERTCFLHACMRSRLLPQVTLDVQGRTIPVAT